MSEIGARGRSFHNDSIPSGNKLTPYGLNLQERWERALKVDPPFVFVTGWNEWIALRLSEFANIKLPVMFVDEFDWEHSRDIEPFGGGTNGGFPEGIAISFSLNLKHVTLCLKVTVIKMHTTTN
jgi:hypothetical protein